jgi:hypothetical protein
MAKSKLNFALECWLWGEKENAISYMWEREQKKVAHTDHSGAILTFIDGLSERASSSEELHSIYFYSMPVGMREIEISRPQQKPNGIYS